MTFIRWTERDISQSEIKIPVVEGDRNFLVTIYERYQ